MVWMCLFLQLNSLCQQIESKLKNAEKPSKDCRLKFVFMFDEMKKCLIRDENVFIEMKLCF